MVKSKLTANLLSKEIAEAAYNKSKQKNVKTPFNVKKAQVIMDYKLK